MFSTNDLNARVIFRRDSTKYIHFNKLHICLSPGIISAEVLQDLPLNYYLMCIISGILLKFVGYIIYTFVLFPLCCLAM